MTQEEILSALGPVIDAVEALRETRDRVILVMDGMSTAGKTTAVDALSRRWNAPVIHMDDFYLPRELRTEARRAEPGGNVHYERFLEEVLPHLRAGESFTYRLFDCATLDFAGVRTVPAAPVTIVEGAYAMHPRFGDYGDVTVFFSIDPEEQLRRAQQREPEHWEDFRDLWIPLENAYHEACHTRERADIVL